MFCVEARRYNERNLKGIQWSYSVCVSRDAGKRPGTKDQVSCSELVLDVETKTQRVILKKKVWWRSLKALSSMINMSIPQSITWLRTTLGMFSVAPESVFGSLKSSVFSTPRFCIRQPLGSVFGSPKGSVFSTPRFFGSPGFSMC